MVLRVDEFQESWRSGFLAYSGVRGAGFVCLVPGRSALHDGTHQKEARSMRPKLFQGGREACFVYLACGRFGVSKEVWIGSFHGQDVGNLSPWAPGPRALRNVDVTIARNLTDACDDFLRDIRFDS